MKNIKLADHIGIIALVVLIIFIAGYYSISRWNPASPSAPNVATASNSNITPQTSPAASGEGGFFLFDIFGTELSHQTGAQSVGVFEIIARLFLAVLLAAILAFRPRKNVRLFERNLYVAQTQILLGVVAAALMMIIGDNAARAFAIFAAVSLVRFRTNVRDPKEVTVLLVCLALGLAIGVGRWDLGIALCLFVLVLLKLLEFNETEQAFRSMDLTVRTRNPDSTQDTLKKIFDRHKLQFEVRQINLLDEANPIGSIVYYLNLRMSLSTDYLSEQIFESDPDNTEGVQWEQQKNATDIYQ
ncbi:MAG: DUF4956 domain-containing protein [Acidobacteriota bacterium]|nr:DUF4956 domain-containing protein [Acidobacteriota bacterium]